MNGRRDGSEKYGKSWSIRGLGLLACALLCMAKVHAEEEKSSDGKPKKTISLTFDDELIEGDIKKPELLYLMQQRRFNFKKLIKLRNDFLPEMNRTAEEIKTTGDGK